MTNELKFLIGGLLGFALAVPAGIMQADVGLNRVLHNTQWVVGPHVHVAILVGLTMTLYSAVYFLLPILTNGAKLWSQKLATLHFWCHLVGGVGMGAFMGMAGSSPPGGAGGVPAQHRDDARPQGRPRHLPQGGSPRDPAAADRLREA